MRKKPRPERPALQPGPANEVEMLSVPKDGQVTVRILGNARSLLSHRVGEDSFACPGLRDCPTVTHRAKTTWKAYAPCEMWFDAPYNIWVPMVLEITERLWEKLVGRNLRGEYWTLFRQVGRHGHKEVCGELVDVTSGSSLRNDVKIEATVQRVYRTKDIAWDVPLHLPARAVLAPSSDPPPPLASNQRAEQPPASAAELKAMLDASRKRLAKATGSATHSRNGTH